MTKFRSPEINAPPCKINFRELANDRSKQLETYIDTSELEEKRKEIDTKLLESLDEVRHMAARLTHWRNLTYLSIVNILRL
jgi:hypothetical protein